MEVVHIPAAVCTFLFVVGAINLLLLLYDCWIDNKNCKSRQRELMEDHPYHIDHMKNREDEK